MGCHAVCHAYQQWHGWRVQVTIAVRQGRLDAWDDLDRHRKNSILPDPKNRKRVIRPDT